MFSQQDAWIYFTDKPNVASSMANPLTILTQKSINRKNVHGVAIDERDVPVNENYIAQLKNANGITVMAKSKWFNAVHVKGSLADIQALVGFGFVDSIDFAEKSLNTSKPLKEKKEGKLESDLTNFNYGSSLNQLEMLNGDKLHVSYYTGKGMTIALMDAGFPGVNTAEGFKRLRNTGHILDAYDFVDRDSDVYSNTKSNHGTWVLSTMAGYLHNEFVGTAPDASYYLFITEDALSENPVEESYWVEAAERADSLGVDIINTSLGYTTYDNPNYSYKPSDMDGQTAFITRGANIAYEKGMLVVVSAGNSGNDSWRVVGAPADAQGVLSVGAVDTNGDYASFSSNGSNVQPTQKPDVVAQGQASYLITETNAIRTANGTSFSAPIMAGGIACLWQAFPDKTNAEIMALVRESASQYHSPDFLLGYGIPDLQSALFSAFSYRMSDQIKLFPNPTVGRIYFNFPMDEPILELNIFDALGRQVDLLNVSIDSNNIDISNLSSGIYLIKMASQNFSEAFKIIKK